MLVRIKARGGAGIWHTQIVTQALCIAEGGELFALLASLGLKITPAKGGKDRLRALLCLASPGKLVSVASRIGWHGERTFVLPDEAFGELSGEHIAFQPEHPVPHNYKRKGTFEGWRNEVAARAIGNSRLAFGLSAAFAGPLLQPLNIEGGGFHLRGDSSTGKTSSLWMAGSVWGGGGLNGFMQSWRTTDNGLEGRAVLHSDTLYLLDELAMAAGTAASRIAYFLANGQGKARAGIAGEGRPIAEFRVFFLSTGEISLAAKLAEDGLSTMAGQETRFIDLEADAGAGMGSFESIHSAETPAAFADAVKSACHEHYGHAGREFLRHLLAGQAEALDEAVHLMEVFATKACPAQLAAQVSRAAKRFALVAAAGELATLWGILPWPSGTAMAAAVRMFREWLERRGTPGALESMRALAQVRAMLEKHGASRFMPVDTDLRLISPSTPVNGRLGYVKRPAGDDDGGEVFYVLPEMFRSEICKGLDAARVAQELARAGALIPDTDGKRSQTLYFPGTGQKRVYVIDAVKLGE